MNTELFLAMFKSLETVDSPTIFDTPDEARFQSFLHAHVRWVLQEYQLSLPEDKCLALFAKVLMPMHLKSTPNTEDGQFLFRHLQDSKAKQHDYLTLFNTPIIVWGEGFLINTVDADHTLCKITLLDLMLFQFKYDSIQFKTLLNWYNPRELAPYFEQKIDEFLDDTSADFRNIDFVDCAIGNTEFQMLLYTMLDKAINHEKFNQILLSKYWVNQPEANPLPEMENNNALITNSESICERIANNSGIYSIPLIDIWFYFIKANETQALSLSDQHFLLTQSLYDILFRSANNKDISLVECLSEHIHAANQFWSNCNLNSISLKTILENSFSLSQPQYACVSLDVHLGGDLDSCAYLDFSILAILSHYCIEQENLEEYSHFLKLLLSNGVDFSIVLNNEAHYCQTIKCLIFSSKEGDNPESHYRVLLDYALSEHQEPQQNIKNYQAIKKQLNSPPDVNRHVPDNYDNYKNHFIEILDEKYSLIRNATIGLIKDCTADTDTSDSLARLPDDFEALNKEFTQGYFSFFPSIQDESAEADLNDSKSSPPKFP